MSREFHCRQLLTPEGWVENCTLTVAEDGLISGITHEPAPEHAVPVSGTVIPGMVNVHSHIHQRLIAGLTGYRRAESDSFWTWREQMYRAVGMLETGDLEMLAARSFMELLEGGYTTTGEFHYPHRLGGSEPLDTAMTLIKAANRSGMALTLLPVWYCYGGFGRRPVSERQQPFVMDQAQIAQLIGELEQETAGTVHRAGVAPHSLRAIEVTDLPGLLEAIPGGPVHLHISEQLAEVDECRRHCGQTPIALLTDHVELDKRWCLIHATHATVGEIRDMAESDAVVGLCPTTEADLGDGLFPVRSFMNLGGSIAIGSDSNLVTEAAGELRLLEWGQRLEQHERNVLCAPGEHIGAGLWQETAGHGATALAQPVGRLEPGRRADFVVLDTTHPLLEGLTPDYQLDTFVMARAPAMIDEVYVAGQRRVSNGRHPDRTQLDHEWVRLRKRLLEAS